MCSRFDSLPKVMELLAELGITFFTKVANSSAFLNREDWGTKTAPQRDLGGGRAKHHTTNCQGQHQYHIIIEQWDSKSRISTKIIIPDTKNVMLEPPWNSCNYPSIRKPSSLSLTRCRKQRTQRRRKSPITTFPKQISLLPHPLKSSL